MAKEMENPCVRWTWSRNGGCSTSLHARNMGLYFLGVPKAGSNKGRYDSCCCMRSKKTAGYSCFFYGKNGEALEIPSTQGGTINRCWQIRNRKRNRANLNGRPLAILRHTTFKGDVPRMGQGKRLTIMASFQHRKPHGLILSIPNSWFHA